MPHGVRRLIRGNNARSTGNLKTWRSALSRISLGSWGSKANGQSEHVRGFAHVLPTILILSGFLPGRSWEMTKWWQAKDHVWLARMWTWYRSWSTVWTQWPKVTRVCRRSWCYEVNPGWVNHASCGNFTRVCVTASRNLHTGHPSQARTVTQKLIRWQTERYWGRRWMTSCGHQARCRRLGGGRLTANAYSPSYRGICWLKSKPSWHSGFLLWCRRGRNKLACGTVCWPSVKTPQTCCGRRLLGK